jgi:putative transposase
MPWRQVSTMEQRMQFVLEYQSELFTMTELSEQYGISRKTAHKWIARYDAEGVVGLLDRSRRPHHYPQATDPTVVEALVALRKRHPRWGAKKLLAIAARREPGTAWPSRSTVCALLKQRGLVGTRRRRSRWPAIATPRMAITQSNDVWTTDFKGEFRTGDGAYCYPLTLRDGFSRFALRCDALLSPSGAETRRRFERAFHRYGLPLCIRSDNGEPFAGTGLAGLSQLAVWWMRLGIVPERIAPGHPEQNGSHEQFHAVLKAATTRPPAAHATAQQHRFRRFCQEYNYERPHEALAGEVPARYYQPSPRPLPTRLPALEYPAHLEVRRVSNYGCVRWHVHRLFLSNALAGEDVAFEEIDDGLWTIFFAAIPLGRFDERTRRIHPIVRTSAGRSAGEAGSAPDA